jgi:hypothetical protein
MMYSLTNIYVQNDLFASVDSLQRNKFSIQHDKEMTLHFKFD